MAVSQAATRLLLLLLYYISNDLHHLLLLLLHPDVARSKAAQRDYLHLDGLHPALVN